MRGDDGAGPEVARLVRSAGLTDVGIIDHDGEAAGLIDAWDGADLAVVVDCVRPGTAGRGHIFRVDVDRTAPGRPVTAAMSSHDIQPGDAVALARVLDRLPGRLVLFGIEAASIEAGAGLSSHVAAAVGRVANLVIDEISTFRQDSA